MIPITKLIDGEPRTLESIIKEYRGLVWRMSIRYAQEYDRDDITSEGFLGLMRAYEKYVPMEGATFKTYAYKMITSYMLKLVRKPAQGLHFPHEIVGLGWRIVANDLYENPIGFIAHALNANETHVERALMYLHTRNPARLDVTFADTESGLYDIVGTVDDHTKFHVNEFINSLDEREQTIVQCLYKEMPQHEIGAIIGVSQMQVSRLIKKIREKYQEYDLEGVI